MTEVSAVEAPNSLVGHYAGPMTRLLAYVADLFIAVSAYGLLLSLAVFVWNVLVENKLLKENGWIEYSIFPLFSPQALIGEGSANYGVDLSFPDDDKSQYERDILFPLAGLDPEKALTLNRLNKLTRKLSHAITATAQAYLDGKISRDEAIEQRRKYALTSRDRAEQSVRFIEQYRSYVLNYNFGKDVVQAYIEKQGDDQRSRWQAFERMLTGLPSVSAMTE